MRRNSNILTYRDMPPLSRCVNPLGPTRAHACTGRGRNIFTKTCPNGMYVDYEKRSFDVWRLLVGFERDTIDTKVGKLVTNLRIGSVSLSTFMSFVRITLEATCSLMLLA